MSTKRPTIEEMVRALGITRAQAEELYLRIKGVLPNYDWQDAVYEAAFEEYEHHYYPYAIMPETYTLPYGYVIMYQLAEWRGVSEDTRRVIVDNVGRLEFWHSGRVSGGTLLPQTLWYVVTQPPQARYGEYPGMWLIGSPKDVARAVRGP